MFDIIFGIFPLTPSINPKITFLPILINSSMCNDFFKFSLNFSNTSIILSNVMLSEVSPKFLMSSTSCENVCTTGVKYCLTLFQIFLTQLAVSFNALLTIGRSCIFFAIFLIQLPRSESLYIKLSIIVCNTPCSLI